MGTVRPGILGLYNPGIFTATIHLTDPKNNAVLAALKHLTSKFRDFPGPSCVMGHNLWRSKTRFDKIYVIAQKEFLFEEFFSKKP